MVHWSNSYTHDSFCELRAQPLSLNRKQFLWWRWKSCLSLFVKTTTTTMDETSAVAAYSPASLVLILLLVSALARCSCGSGHYLHHCVQLNVLFTFSTLMYMWSFLCWLFVGNLKQTHTQCFTVILWFFLFLICGWTMETGLSCGRHVNTVVKGTLLALASPGC